MEKSDLFVVNFPLFGLMEMNIRKTTNFVELFRACEPINSFYLNLQRISSPDKNNQTKDLFVFIF